MQDRVWICRDGRHVVVSKMETRHIINCIRLIQKSGGRWRGEFLDRLQLELEIRNLRDAA